MRQRAKNVQVFSVHIFYSILFLVEVKYRAEISLKFAKIGSPRLMYVR